MKKDAEGRKKEEKKKHKINLNQFISYKIPFCLFGNFSSAGDGNEHWIRKHGKSCLRMNWVNIIKRAD